jgi:hypothetical protein
MRHQTKQNSINEFLDLGQRAWFVELEIGDFGASIANLLELPQVIFEQRPKVNFWAFLQLFLQNCDISFILRQPYLDSPDSERIELALLGYWNDKHLAIPLWIIKNLLMGFEIITEEQYIILDSEPLNWSPYVLHNKWWSSSRNSNKYCIYLTDDIFQGHKIYFKIEKGRIEVSNYFDEVKFFSRIAMTSLPQSDEWQDE